ncbi:MAG: hypothetical protein JSS60_01365 [Verrucomicrobia bacterium]|nr:hypothetical protein [Verrucomicrobiota bacterium]
MTKKGTTKDELFLLKLHELATERGDVGEAICRFEIGRAIGQNDKGANVIARDLAQANFVKKGEGESVFLTNNGLRLVESLREDN